MQSQPSVGISFLLVVVVVVVVVVAVVFLWMAERHFLPLSIFFLSFFLISPRRVNIYGKRQSLVQLGDELMTGSFAPPPPPPFLFLLLLLLLLLLDSGVSEVLNSTASVFPLEQTKQFRNSCPQYLDIHPSIHLSIHTHTHTHIHTHQTDRHTHTHPYRPEYPLHPPIPHRIITSQPSGIHQNDPLFSLIIIPFSSSSSVPFQFENPT